MSNSDMEEVRRMAYLLSGFVNQQLNAEEEAELDAWIAAHPDNKALATRMRDTGYRNNVLSGWSPGAAEASLLRIKHRISASQRLPLSQKIASVAAAVILLAGVGITWFQLTHTGSPAIPISYKNDVSPGTDKAILTLADGSKISLTDAPKGRLANPAGITIVKTTSGDVVYNVSPVSSDEAKVQYNTLETPAGGQYRIQLPDGSRVWLNAMSSLKFPQNFLGLKERKVELSGEAYFEVAPNREQPFIVQTDHQQTAVLGTHFDIKSYKEEPFASTTLLEGSVRTTDTKLSQSRILQPGEQFLSDEQSLSVRRVDTLSVVDWKNGEFIFHNENIRNMMREIARWYNVQVIFRDNSVDYETFSGSVSRYGNVSELLKTLQLTGRVRFDIEGRKIFVDK